MGGQFREETSVVIARSESDEAIQSYLLQKTGLLRFARNDGGEILQLLLPGRRPGLALLVLLPVLFVGAVAAVGAAGDGAEHAVVAGIVTGDAADHGALQAALGVRRRGGNECKRGDGENGG